LFSLEKAVTSTEEVYVHIYITTSFLVLCGLVAIVPYYTGRALIICIWKQSGLREAS